MVYLDRGPETRQIIIPANNAKALHETALENEVSFGAALRCLDTWPRATALLQARSMAVLLLRGCTGTYNTLEIVNHL